MYSYELGELGRYYREYTNLMAHWRNVLPAGVMLDVQYEEVVDDFERQARRGERLVLNGGRPVAEGEPLLRGDADQITSAIRP